MTKELFFLNVQFFSQCLIPCLQNVLITAASLCDLLITSFWTAGAEAFGPGQRDAASLVVLQRGKAGSSHMSPEHTPHTWSCLRYNSQISWLFFFLSLTLNVWGWKENPNLSAKRVLDLFFKSADEAEASFLEAGKTLAELHQQSSISPEAKTKTELEISAGLYRYKN